MNALHSFHRGAGLAAALLFLIAMTSAWAAAPTAPPAARSELAPTGKLRVGLLVRNTSYVTKDGPATEMQGVAVDLARELAKQLGVTLEPVRYDAVSKMMDGAKAGDWDVAFLGFEPARTGLIDFTAPYAAIGNSYLVAGGSPIRSISDVDKPGHRIGVSQRSAQDAFVTRNIKQAQLIRVSANSESVKLLASGKIDALVANRTALLALVKEVPGSRILEGSIFNVDQSIGIPKGRPAGTAYAKKFIDYAKSSGLVQQAIDRAGVRGMNVAPASSK
jgi:polar amino acid transport system substrate-binding protein